MCFNSSLGLPCKQFCILHASSLQRFSAKRLLSASIRYDKEKEEGKRRAQLGGGWSMKMWAEFGGSGLCVTSSYKDHFRIPPHPQTKWIMNNGVDRRERVEWNRWGAIANPRIPSSRRILWDVREKEGKGAAAASRVTRWTRRVLKIKESQQESRWDLSRWTHFARWTGRELSNCSNLWFVIQRDRPPGECSFKCRLHARFNLPLSIPYTAGTSRLQLETHVELSFTYPSVR